MAKAPQNTNRNLQAVDDPIDRDDGNGSEFYKDYQPHGFDDVDSFLTWCREEFDADAAYDRQNREAALDDLMFVGMDQWDPLVRAAREKQGRPCLTVNVLPQFIGQVIGDRRQNKTQIKVAPRKDSTVAMANTRTSIIKSIEAYSRAEKVYDAALENQVTCGIGNFRISLDYSDNDVFEQDIFLRNIPNPLAVIWDRMSIDNTGRDARHCFVQDAIPRKTYEEMFPDAPSPSELGDDIVNSLLQTGWFTKDVVRITEVWRMIQRMRTLCLYQDGAVVDVTDMDPKEWMPLAFIDPATGRPKTRRAPRTYAQMHLITGFSILEGPYELPLNRLPIIKVEGRVVNVGEDRVRFGLVRFAKDPQRLKNYWRSVMAENLAMSPKNQWLAQARSVDGREDDFREAHLSGDPLLIYNDGTDAPTRENPPPVQTAVMQEVQLNTQDIKDTTGLQDASLGIRSNEISGRAIDARKTEGDVATIIYHDNLNASIQEGGDVVNQLLGYCYDNIRVMRVIGADDKHSLMTVNDPNDPNSIDLTVGKYDVSVITGPSYTTQRQEAAAAMMEAIKVAPQLMGIAGDLIVKAQDWPGAEEIAQRLKLTLPPAILQSMDPNELSPQQQQAMQQAQQSQAGQQAVQMAEISEQMQHASDMRKIELATKQTQLETANAQTATAQAQAVKAGHEAAGAEHDAIVKHAAAKEAHAKAHEAGVHDRAASLHHILDLHHQHEDAEANRSRQDDQHRQGMKQGQETHKVKTQQMRAKPKAGAGQKGPKK